MGLLHLYVVVLWMWCGCVVLCGRHYPHAIGVVVYVCWRDGGFVLYFICVMLVLVVVVTASIG